MVNFPDEVPATSTPHAPDPSAPPPPRPVSTCRAQMAPDDPGREFGAELEAAEAIGAALARLERPAALRVLAFVCGHYQLTE